MIQASEIKRIVFDKGADLCGIANVDRFTNAPTGFHPKDIYSETETIIVFALQLPSESLYAENPVPYSHVNDLVTKKMDEMTFDISIALEKHGIKNVLIPSDDPYLSWDAQQMTGRAILSLRHAGHLAGLGGLAKNGLLLNREYGNMIQLGAVLTNAQIPPDPIADYEVCPPQCKICLDHCPQNALTGDTVIQKLCRPISNYRTEKGYFIKMCFECRKKCPRSLGLPS